MPFCIIGCLLGWRGCRRGDGNATPPKKLRNNPNTISIVSCVKRIQFTPSTTTPPVLTDMMIHQAGSNTLKRFPPSRVNRADCSKKTSLTPPWMHYKKLHQQHSSEEIRPACPKGAAEVEPGQMGVISGWNFPDLKIRSSPAVPPPPCSTFPLLIKYVFYIRFHWSSGE